MKQGLKMEKGLSGVSIVFTVSITPEATMEGASYRVSPSAVATPTGEAAFAAGWWKTEQAKEIDP